MRAVLGIPIAAFFRRRLHVAKVTSYFLIHAKYIYADYVDVIGIGHATSPSAGIGTVQCCSLLST